MTIILYDFPSTLPGKAWNPNVWKTRYSLNFKGLPYKTEWIEYPDVEPHFKKLGIPPTRNKPDGSPMYTLPAIHDTASGVYIADSILIAEYLENTYPDTPRIFPNGTLGLQSAFNNGLIAQFGTIWSLIHPTVPLNSMSAAYITLRNKGEYVIQEGKAREEAWKKVEEGFNKVDAWYARNGKKGPFIFGDVPSWADLALASFLVFLRRVWGESSGEWQDIASWNGGRWKIHNDYFRVYETIL